jgi:hypothetical protein
MLSATAALIIVLVADAADHPAIPVEPARGSEASLSIVSGTPPVLSGLATGVAVEGQRHLAGRPLFLGGRLQWTDSSGANELWIIDHQQFIAAASIGVAASTGVARLWLQLGGGAAAVREVLTRHPGDQGPGIAGGSESAFTVGPYAFGEGGAGLVLRGWVRAFMAAGPTVARTTVDGGGRWRVGALGRLGVAYDF